MPLETHFVEGACRREIKLLSREGARHVAIFLDGEHYWRDLDAVPLLIGLPAHLVFVSHVSREDRLADFLWNEEYAKFIGNEVFGWVANRFPEIEPDGHLLAGLSLSGLEAALIAFRFPDRFGRVLCQSGSFWWLEDHPQPVPETGQRFWLSVGSDETATHVTHFPTLFQRVSQIEGVERMAERLRAAGATVRYRPYEGGHAAAPWRAELVEAMEWLFSPG